MGSVLSGLNMALGKSASAQALARATIASLIEQDGQCTWHALMWTVITADTAGQWHALTDCFGRHRRPCSQPPQTSKEM